MMRTQGFRTAALAAVAVLLMVGAWRWLTDTAPAVIGAYDIPILPGWDRKFSRDFRDIAQTDTVTFRRTLGGVPIVMTFHCNTVFHKKTPYPTTPTELQASRAAKVLSGAAPAQLTPFHGRPALHLQRVTHQNGVTTREQRLVIGDPRGNYVSTQTITVNGASIPPAVQAEADRAWDTLNNGIRDAAPTPLSSGTPPPSERERGR